MMAAGIEAFKRGDEVLSKFPGDSIMTVSAVEGLKVRCADSQNTQYWFDTMMLERYEHPRRLGETSAATCASDSPRLADVIVMSSRPAKALMISGPLAGPRTDTTGGLRWNEKSLHRRLLT
jgi:hypothetical protein